MDQECEKCGKRFRLAVLKTVMELSNYPIQSRALYCPYCGYNEDAPKLMEAAPDLLAALRPFAALWLRALETAPDDKPIWQLGEAIITVGDVKAARAAIAKAEAADDTA